MLHLDPAHPPLWRTPDSLQFGPDKVAVLDHPDQWQERMIQELERGLPDSALDPVATALGGTVDRARSLVAALSPALEQPAPAPAPPVAVRALGPTVVPAAHEIARGLREAGVDLVHEPAVDAVAVLVAAHVIDPAAVRPLMQADAPHLPIVLHGRRVTVGPLVHPGRTACLLCIEADRRDADPAWPALAGQLLALPAPDLVPGLAVEAGLVAARLLSVAGRGDATWSLTVDARSMRRRWWTHRPHAECGCRSPAGISTASGSGAPDFRATTTTTVSGPPV